MKGPLALCLCVAAFASCDRPSRERIERWRADPEGEAPLLRLLTDDGAAADLRARAAAALVARGDVDAVVHALPGKAPVLEALIPLLAADATPAGPLQRPTSAQIAAKDALFALRPLATPAQQEAIDGHLADWLATFYEGRARLGAYPGEVILRAIGPRAGPRLVAETRALLAKGDAAHYVLVKDEVLRGLALAGPDGIGFLLDLAEKKDLSDETLRVRAMQALAATTPDVASALPRLVVIAADPTQPGENGNVAFDLIASTGPSRCLAPLAVLVQSRDPVRSWAAVQHGLDCGGANAIGPMAEALPADREYPPGIIDKYFLDKIVALGPASLGPARALLRSPSWVARLTGIEVLARLGSASDAALLRPLGDDSAALRGWPAGTLGREATAIADRLEKRQERK